MKYGDLTRLVYYAIARDGLRTSWEVSAATDLPLKKTTSAIAALRQRGLVRRAGVTGKGGKRGRKLVEYEAVT